MARKKRNDGTAVGEDSFLDITANLVGILIILVVVIGTKTKLDAEEYSRSQIDDQPPAQLQSTANTAQALRDAVAKQQVNHVRYDMEVKFRESERRQVLVKVSKARELIDDKMSQLDESRQASIARQQQRAQLEDQLSDTKEQLGASTEMERPKVILEHLPTPMAKTVFSREMHIQMQHGAVAVIPWDRLVATLKERGPLSARRNASRQQIEDILGPIGGFLMHYRMNAVPGGFELDQFELEAVDGAPFESLEEAFAPAGRLRLELASRDPRETVVTVWVYEDSFEEFRTLKNRLFNDGFLTAARPLPAGVLIGASPRGSRSSAQ